MAQLMPVPLIVSCFSKIQIGSAFLVPAYPGSPGQRAVKRVCVCVCVCVCPRSYLQNYTSSLHEIFCACFLWPWLGPSVAAYRYVVYFQFYG